MAIALIVWPNRPGQGTASPGIARPEVLTIDPAQLVPQLTELPAGSSVQSNTYISTAQSSRQNQISLKLLQSVGREIGFDRDFTVPQYGDIDIEVVRFKSHAGMGRAYTYFLGLPSAHGMTSVPVSGLGERAALVTNPQAGFVEFMRGRYYAVITTIPATHSTLAYIHRLASRLDDRILHYGPSA